jgi:hypothetical protein
MTDDKSENLTIREFELYKYNQEGKMDALFAGIKELNDTLRELLIDRASDKAFALIGKWCLVLIPAMTAILGVVALWRKG